MDCSKKLLAWGRKVGNRTILNLNELRQNILLLEKTFLQNEICNNFREPILQLGDFSCDYFKNNNYILVSDQQEITSQNNNYLFSNYNKLPFSPYTNFRTVLIPHVLEFNDNYQEIIQEIYNILMPEQGRLIIFSFNSYSLWRLRYKGLKMHKLKSALTDVGFEIITAQNFYLRPPINSNFIQSILFPFERLNPLLPFGAINMLIAMKRVVPLTPTRLKWAQEERGATNEWS